MTIFYRFVIVILIVLSVGLIGDVGTKYLFSTMVEKENNSETGDVVSTPMIAAPSTTTEVTVPVSPVKVEVEQPIKQARKKISTLAINPDRTLLMVGVVNARAQETAIQITQLAQQSNSPIYLFLSGPGGSVFDGAAVIAAMQASKAPVYTICHYLCASMDAMIHQYGKERYMTDRSILMFHPASAGAGTDDVDRLLEFIKLLKRYVNKMEYDVALRSGRTFDQYKALSNPNLWLDSEDALANRFADKIVSVSIPMAQSNPLSTDDKGNIAKSDKRFYWIMPGYRSWFN